MSIYMHCENGRRKLFFIALWLTWLCFFSSTAGAMERTVEGRGPSEKAALQDAFQKALENAYGIELNSSTYVANNLLIHDQTTMRTNGYIRKYFVLEQRQHQGSYVVKIKAEVDRNPVVPAPKPDNSRLQQAVRSPYIGIMILDQNSSQAVTDAFAENAVIDRLRAIGFSHAVQIPAARSEPGLSRTEPFDYIIKGTIDCTPVKTPFKTQMPLASSEARLTLTLSKGATADTIEQTQYQECGIDITAAAAAENAKSKAASMAVNDIAKKLQECATAPSNSYTLCITGIKDFHALASFKDYLNYLPNTGQISLRSYADTTAIIDIVFGGDDQWLSLHLTENLAYPATITRIADHTIYLTLQ